MHVQKTGLTPHKLGGTIAIAAAMSQHDLKNQVHLVAENPNFNAAQIQKIRFLIETYLIEKLWRYLLNHDYFKLPDKMAKYCHVVNQ